MKPFQFGVSNSNSNSIFLVIFVVTFVGAVVAAAPEGQDNNNAELHLKIPETEERSLRDQDPHFTNIQSMHDVIFALCEGLTVPFALAAGLSGANVNGKVVVKAGLAEVVAGSIALALGGLLAGDAEYEHWNAENLREQRHFKDYSKLEMSDVVNQMSKEFDLEKDDVYKMLSRMKKPQLIKFMLQFEHGIAQPASKDIVQSALTIGISHLIAGTIPLFPYALMSNNVRSALKVSTLITLGTLISFGALKGYMMDSNPVESAVETASVGLISAGAAYLLSKFIASLESKEEEEQGKKKKEKEKKKHGKQN